MVLFLVPIGAFASINKSHIPHKYYEFNIVKYINFIINKNLSLNVTSPFNFTKFTMFTLAIIT